jgi:hypothetical protein
MEGRKGRNVNLLDDIENLHIHLLLLFVRIHSYKQPCMAKSVFETTIA